MKLCAHCGAPYPKPAKYSVAQWTLSRFCSKSCRARALPITPETRLKIKVAITGRNLSEEQKRKIGVAAYRRGWKGGVSDDGAGYLRVNSAKQRVHRQVVERFVGRKLRSDEVVHHKDLDKRNNDISNLKVMTASEHGKLHASIRASKWKELAR